MEEKFNKIINDNLAEYYKQYEFTNKNEWFRYENNGFEILFLQSRKDIGRITYCPQFRVYVESVTKILNEVFPQNLINPCSVHNTGAGMAQTLNVNSYNTTKYNNFGNLSFTRYEAHNEIELHEIIQEHKIFVKNIAFPYFKKYTTLKSAYEFIYELIMKGNLKDYLSQKRQQELLNQVGTREIYSTIIIGNKLKLAENDDLMNRLRTKFINTRIWENIEKINSHFK
jgi:hypothetical protein